MKHAILSILFVLIFCLPISLMGDVVVQKEMNRYYILNHAKEWIEHEEKYDVEIFGSCHAYTSFHVPYFQEQYGYEAFNFSNPGEFIPITYVQMAQKFRREKPRAVLVEVWGVQVYNTYQDYSEILGDYARLNLEGLDFSKEKTEVILDFRELDFINLNFKFFRYKNRIKQKDITSVDFSYSYEKLKEEARRKNKIGNFAYIQMDRRLKSGGSDILVSKPLEDYDKQQVNVGNRQTALEPLMLKYIHKIIELCRENDVELIFYRAPYISKEEEAEKINFLSEYLAEMQVPFYDLEKEIHFDPLQDFSDYQHLAEPGMQKATDFLGEKLHEILQN